MESGEKKENAFKRPPPDPIHLQKHSLEEKEKEEDPDHLAEDHGEKVGSVGHTAHQADLHK